MGAVTNAACAGLAPYFCGTVGSVALAACELAACDRTGTAEMQVTAVLSANGMERGVQTQAWCTQACGTTAQSKPTPLGPPHLDDARLLGHSAGAAAGVHAAVAWGRWGGGRTAPMSARRPNEQVECTASSKQLREQLPALPRHLLMQLRSLAATAMHPPHGSGCRPWLTRSMARLGPATSPCRQHMLSSLGCGDRNKGADRQESAPADSPSSALLAGWQANRPHACPSSLPPPPALLPLPSHQ